MKIAIMILSFIALSACTVRTAAAANVLSIRGSTEQISSLLADERFVVGPSLKFLGDSQEPGGQRVLRYLVSEATPYRDVGGLIFYAQHHGAHVAYGKLDGARR